MVHARDLEEARRIARTREEKQRNTAAKFMDDRPKKIASKKTEGVDLLSLRSGKGLPKKG